jgi:hypothetical protein
MKGQLSGKQAAFNIDKKAKCCAIYLFFENCWILSGPEPERRSRKRNQNFPKVRTWTEPERQQIIMVTQHCFLDYDKNIYLRNFLIRVSTLDCLSTQLKSKRWQGVCSIV